MNYKETGSKKPNGDAVAEGVILRNPTHKTLWILVKKHKVALLATYAVSFTLAQTPLPDIALGLISSI